MRDAEAIPVDLWTYVRDIRVMLVRVKVRCRLPLSSLCVATARSFLTLSHWTASAPLSQSSAPGCVSGLIVLPVHAPCVHRTLLCRGGSTRCGGCSHPRPHSARSRVALTAASPRGARRPATRTGSCRWIRRRSCWRRPRRCVCRPRSRRFVVPRVLRNCAVPMHCFVGMCVRCRYQGRAVTSDSWHVRVATCFICQCRRRHLLR